MVFAPHWRFQMGGELDGLGTSSWTEVWQCTINGRFPTDLTDPDGWLADRGPAVSSWFGSSDALMSNHARLSWVKLNSIEPDGTYTDPTHPHTFALTPITGTETPVWPADASIAWSWSTDLLRGRGSKGRIYPPNAGTMQAAGANQITTTSQAAHLVAAKGLLTILHTAWDADTFIPVVASELTGVLNDITGVRVGRVIDVQRRRRNKLPESYSASVWP